MLQAKAANSPPATALSMSPALKPFTSTGVARAEIATLPDRGHCGDAAVTRPPSRVYLSIAPGVAQFADTTTVPGAPGAELTTGVATTAAPREEALRTTLFEKVKPEVSPV